MDRPKYWAFLSYSHRDAAWANWLHQALESYRPPRDMIGTRTPRGVVPARLTPVFRDREELASATDLGAEIREALRQSACQIVICSANAARSRWVNEEILAYKRLGREDRILCLIVDGEPNASDDPAQTLPECFPAALRFRLNADGSLGTERTEPIAADARPGRDGRTNAKLKLIAGLLGVSFDSLKRREQRRRHRRMMLVTAAAITGMVITSSLATYALIARATAQRQTARAEAEAATALQTTNFLVDLFRVSDPGEARGNQVTAREVLDKGAARIAIELADQPAVQARLMDTVGTVYMGLGLYREARPLLDAALAQRRQLSATDPLALADSLDHLGDLLTLQAQYAAAERAYRQVAAELANAGNEQRVESRRAHSLFGLGSLLALQGRYEEAEASLRDALDRQQRLYGATHADIARTLQSLAKVISQNGNLKRAVPLMQTALAMQRRLSGDQPHPSLAEIVNDMGTLYMEDGDYADATALFQEAITMKRRLLGERHPEIATALNNLAYVQQNAGQLAQAEVNYRQALAMRRELLGNVHPDVAATLNNLAFLQYDRGETHAALRTEREALAVERALFPGDHPEVARIMNRIGYWLTEGGQYREAQTLLQDALAMRLRLVGPSHPDVASSLTHIAILQVALRHYGAAQDAARRAVEISTAAFSAANWRTAVAASAAGAALDGLGRHAEAEKLLTRSYEILCSDEDALPAYRALTQGYLRALYSHWGHPPTTPRYAFLAAAAHAGASAAAARAAVPQ